MPSAARTPPTDRDADLAAALARAGLGDRAAFARVYDATCAQLFGIVLRIQRDRALAEDVLQEVYVGAWRAAASYDAAQSTPLGWLASIARNRAIDSLRRAQAQPAVAPLPVDDDGDPADPYAQLADDGEGPLALLERAGEARRLADCLGRLTPPQRQSVALAFYDGLSHAEVAARMREPLGTVKSWVRRGLLALKGCLDAAVERDARAAGA